MEHAAHRPGAVAEGAGILQGVPAPSGCSELQPGSGHGRAQEGTDTREPVARMLAGDAGASQNEAPADVGKKVTCSYSRAPTNVCVPGQRGLAAKITGITFLTALYLFHHSLCNLRSRQFLTQSPPRYGAKVTPAGFSKLLSEEAAGTSCSDRVRGELVRTEKVGALGPV